MSQVRANSITNSAGTGAPDFPNGLTVAGGPVSVAKDFITASGISAGYGVKILPDGTVTAMSATLSYAGALSTADTEALSTTEYVVGARADTATTGILVTAVYGTPSVVYVRYISVSASGAITVGPAVTVSTTVQYANAGLHATNISCEKTASNRFAIVYRNSSLTDAVCGRVINISGTTVTVSGETTLLSSGTWANSFVAGANGAGTLIVMYGQPSTYNLMAKVYTVDATSFSGGNVYTIDSTADWYPQDVTSVAATGDWVVASYNTSNNPYAHKLVSSGATLTTWSGSTAIPVTSLGYYTNGIQVIYDSSISKMWVIPYKSMINGQGTTFTTCTVPAGGTAITFDTNSVISPTASIQLDYVAIGGGVLLGLVPSSVTVYVKFNGASATSSTAIAGNLFNNGTPNGSALFGSILVSSNLTGTTYGVTSQTSVDRNTYVGVSTETVTTGQTATVALRGGVVGGLSGLTPAQRYTLGADGSLVAYSGESLGDAMAISATELQVL